MFKKIIGREKNLIVNDIIENENDISKLVSKSRFLVLGAAGSIGQAVTKEIFKRSPKKLHVVDISENNLVELVRDLRSSFGYISGIFQSFCLDIGSRQYDLFIDQDGKYDYVLNLSALKHVRSESNPYTLMRMIEVNILNTEKTIIQSINRGVKKYFCVSTDKATNPVNMMGATKLVMEKFLEKYSHKINISTARFANVAFSDGSLLYGFKQRLEKQQPIVAPNDVKRYFISKEESGQLCLISCLFGDNCDIFFPKLDDSIHLIKFTEIANRFLEYNNYKPLMLSSEKEAREFDFNNGKYWPCFYSESDTTGEKDFEEFYTSDENLDMKSYKDLGIIKKQQKELNFDTELFKEKIFKLHDKKPLKKSEIVSVFIKCLPNFNHSERGKFLDSKM